MISHRPRSRLPFAILPALLLAGCAGGMPPKPAPPPVPPRDMVAAIRDAGASEQSVIDVAPLQDPAAAGLQEDARADERAGRLDAAAAKLDQAIALSPEAPGLLQERAELAVLQHDYARAEAFARRSWDLGPQLGPLCARNWQTVLEMRQRQGDAAGVAAARQGVQGCHKPGIPRY